LEVVTLESCILPEPTTPGSTPAKATIELRVRETANIT